MELPVIASVEQDLIHSVEHTENEEQNNHNHDNNDNNDIYEINNNNQDIHNDKNNEYYNSNEYHETTDDTLQIVQTQTSMYLVNKKEKIKYFNCKTKNFKK